MNRRDMLRMTGAAVAGASLFGFPALAAGSGMSGENGKARRKALVIGAHPDDPETACGGTMVLLRQAGYDVVSVYMTKGQRGISGKSHEEAASIRVAEAEDACRILDVRAVFMSQIDGDSEINRGRYVEMRELIASEKPDVVFTHWPIDSHPDHRVCSLLVYDAWRRLDYLFELYYFEVMSGTQTQLFQPTDYVDISSVADRKRQACFCHESQNIVSLYEKWHDGMECFRGLELRCEKAEAFIHLRRDSNDIFI
ncbi:MAG: PIG-L family deacetylase [Muribaculaceae bacterium]|nr:PIG-L family deacetylase [Muribaculaceae bacterium]